ncbi:MAG TPA: hypothetical protein VHE37_00680 [Nevskiaceae bacterium]|nr:hypothetical protein [Nevskiaceae bacterium]
MKVDLAIERSLDLEAPFERVTGLLEDYETTIRRFPKLRKLKKLGDMTYLWEMAPIGSRIANISHEVVYAARYQVDAPRGRLSWQGMPSHGNAVIHGEFELKPARKGTRLRFAVNGQLRDVPVPLIYRLVAPPFIQGKFTRLVDVFLEKTQQALEGEDA